MAEQLPDGFSKGDAIWGPDGRRVYQVPKISKKERDSFAQSGVDFDQYAKEETDEMGVPVRTAADVEKLAAETLLKEADPEFKKRLAELGVLDINGDL